MLKELQRSISLSHISLFLVGLMWVLPFINHIHQYPITTFYQEWSSALLGLLAITLLASKSYWQHPAIPRIAQLPIGLMCIVLLQWILGKLAYFDQAMLFILYLLFAALLIMLGARLRENLGMERMSQVLAVFLLIGAEISALIGVLQHYRWNTPFNDFVVMKISPSVYGNMGQPNHYANYISLGLISLGLLYQQKIFRIHNVVLLATPLLFVLSLSGSRSSWLYLLLMICLAWWWARRDASQRSLLRYSLALIAGFGIMHLALLLPFLGGADSSVTTMQRLFGDNASGGIRLYLWRESVMMLMQSPFLGAGFGQFAWHHFQMLPELRGNVTGLYNNAHSLIFNLAAETGIAGLLVLFGSLAVWLYGLRHSRLEASHWWGHAALGVLAIHSLLEYPMWYAYFLAIAAILIGVLDETRYQLKLRKLGRASVVTILILGLTSLVQLFFGYRDLEQVRAISSASSVDSVSSMILRDKLKSVYSSSLLSPYAELYMSPLIEVNDDNLMKKLELNTRVMHFIPIGHVVYRQALLLAQAGQLENAKTIMVQAIWSYPGSFGPVHKQMTELAQKDPARFSALLEFALQKAQEYHRAVSKR